MKYLTKFVIIGKIFKNKHLLQNNENILENVIGIYLRFILFRAFETCLNI